MDPVRSGLHRFTLPPSKPHNSLRFMNAPENVQIHHREFRTIYSISEFFEFVCIITFFARRGPTFPSTNHAPQETMVTDKQFIASGTANR